MACGQSSLNSYGGLSSDSVPVTRRHTSSLKREVALTAVADIENKCHCTFLNTCGTLYANPVTNSLMILMRERTERRDECHKYASGLAVSSRCAEETP